MKADGSNYGNQRQAGNSVAPRGIPPLKDLLNSEYAKKRFAEVMGEKSAAFLASVLNATRTNAALNECDPQSVISAAMVAATLDLPVDPSLGFSAIVPYKNKGKMVAQFQIMTKGFVQLALRSGQYKTINVGPVYEDEFDSYDIISGDVHIHPVDGGYREQDNQDKIIGYVAFFRLLNGFERIEFWSKKKITAHGQRFSKSFDREYGLWKTDFPSMAAKTVLKNTLSKWGILSTTMATAMKTDQASIKDYDGKQLDDANVEYVDSTEVDSSTEGQEGASETKTETKDAGRPESPPMGTEPTKAATSKPAVEPPKAAAKQSAAGPSDDELFSGPNPAVAPEDDLF